MQNSQKSPLIRFHGAFPFDRAAKSRWLLNEVGAAYEDRWLDTNGEDFNAPAFLKLNPMGRVPVMEFGDQIMFESGAICEFLADYFADSGMAPAPTAAERGVYLQWMYFSANTIDVIQSKMMIIEDIPAGDVRTEKEARLLTEMEDVVTTLDRTLSKNSHLVGNHFSAADICVAYHLYWCTMWPELNQYITKSAAVVDFMKRMQSCLLAIKANVFSFEQ